VAKAVPFPKGYSIDATEVTRAQYAAWLATNPPLGNQPAQCVWNTSFEPERALPIFGCDDEVWPPGAKADHPVVCVDWCDASAYCAAVGKRLCGRIGGGANGFEDFADPGKSQWFAACRSDAGNTYPYGDTYEEQTCNGYHRTDTGCGGSGSCITVEAGSLPGCQSKTPGYEGVYDLSGNVWEWEDSCSESTGSEDFCRLRGGSKAQADLGLTCDMEFGEGYARDSVSDTAGFRCCKD
jgi:formylglycine-generating enzyme required for sulfatase activity